ncbi:MAG: RNA polymerase subunit sigma-70 [Eubacteriales bacterium]
MTDFEKKEVQRLRAEGLGYTKVAQTLNISENTVKSYCRRNNLGISEKIEEEFAVDIANCKFCGKELHQHEKQKKRKFCNESCRTKYWTKNQEKINRKSAVTEKCFVCGIDFTDYVKNKRKYCSRKCYQVARYKGGASDES